MKYSYRVYCKYCRHRELKARCKLGKHEREDHWYSPQSRMGPRCCDKNSDNDCLDFHIGRRWRLREMLGYRIPGNWRLALALVKCSNCNGMGNCPPDGWRCPRCNGTGKAEVKIDPRGLAEDPPLIKHLD